MDRTAWLLAMVVFVFAAIVFGAVTLGAESSDGSNTRNAVTPGPKLPPGVSAPAQR